MIRIGLIVMGVVAYLAAASLPGQWLREIGMDEGGKLKDEMGGRS